MMEVCVGKYVVVHNYFTIIFKKFININKVIMVINLFYILSFIILLISIILSVISLINSGMVPGPSPPGPVPPIKGDFLKQFRPGINLTGFDAGSDEKGYSCISQNLVNYSFNSGFQLVRMPILPIRIFNSINDVNSSTYNESMFAPTWATNSDVCDDKQPWNVSNYITALKYVLDKNMFVIIDVHENSKHLCSLSDEPLTKEQYSNMWSHISKYIKNNITKNSENILFELYNEPIPCKGNINEEKYNDYQISAIKAIRNNLDNYIIATTWGNWSGVHNWEKDKTLEHLVSALRKENLTTTSSNILIAGHQYCDSNASGVAEQGCDTNSFNKSLWKQWLDYVDRILEDDFKWILTEGNVRCQNNNCPNSNLYKEFIIDLTKTKTCAGYTLWMLTLGDSYQSAAMGLKQDWIDIYKGTYSINTKGYYQFPYTSKVT